MLSILDVNVKFVVDTADPLAVVIVICPVDPAPTTAVIHVAFTVKL